MSILKALWNILIISFFIITYTYGQIKPDWLNKIQIFQFGYGYNINPSLIISKVNFTGQGWGIYFPNSLDKSIFESEINIWHSNGRVYVAFGPTDQVYWNGIVPIPDSHRLKDIDGNFVNHEITGDRQYSLCSEAWKDYVKSENRKAIDWGVDGLHFDGVQVPPLRISKWNAHPASFDSVTMTYFNNYLRNKFSDIELLQKYNITNIGEFNYKNWIISHGLENTWNSEPFTGLTAEFFTFMILATRDFFHDITEDARNYALNKYSKVLTISSNPNFIAEGYSLVDDMDYFLSEHYPFQNDDPYAYTDIKGTKCIKDWPVFVIPEPKENGLPQQTQNMMKLIMADIYASGGQIVFGEKLSEGIVSNYGIHAIGVDFDVLAKYANFITTNSSLYENLKSISSVALLNSHSSRIARYWTVEGNSHIDYGSAFQGTGRLLANSNIQFDCIFAPDSRFTTSPSFTLSQLQKYKVVVLPHTFELSDQQAQILLDYMNGGGVIVAMGSIGTNNPDGTLANRPELLSLQQNEGVKTFGLGKFVYNPTSLGEAYIWDWGIPHSVVKQQFQSMILPYIKQEIKTYPISEVYRPGGATGFLYEDKVGNYILHLVNYDYNEYTDEIATKENFTLKILADTNKTWEAIYCSPDFFGQKVLTTSKDSGYIKMTIPRLDAYGIVVLQENKSVPMLIERIPQTDTTIIGGDSLRFSVNTTDQDKNHLFYQWYVNSVPDSLATDSTYYVHTSRSSIGVDTILVEISDGENKISTKWLVTIRQYKYPKVLFDESHGEQNTISAARAKILSPTHPDWVSFEILKSKMDNNYLTARYETGTITSSLLKDYNVLVLSAPQSNLSSSEINSIVTFVNEGGSLCFLGNAGLNENINTLLKHFGIQFENHVIFEPATQEKDPGNPLINNFTYHRLVNSNSHFNMNWGGSFINISSPAIAIAFSDSTTWRNLDANRIHDSNEPYGPFPIICTAEYGKGRVLCFSDNALHNDYIKWESSPNDDLFLCGMNWLTENANSTVTSIKTSADIEYNFSLNQNYPNPFNNSSIITYTIPINSFVTIKVYDILGKEVSTLVNEEKSAGNYSMRFDGKNLASGIYFYQIRAGKYNCTKKLILLK